MNRQLVNEYQAAEQLCIAVQTLRNWRHMRRGPAYLKISRSVRYKPEDLEAYMDANRIDPEAGHAGD